MDRLPMPAAMPAELAEMLSDRESNQNADALIAEDARTRVRQAARRGESSWLHYLTDDTLKRAVCDLYAAHGNPSAQGRIFNNLVQMAADEAADAALRGEA